MGWNSWDCFGASVTEAEVIANAEFMAAKLKRHGWEYVVVDIQWFEPAAKSNEYNEGAPLVMDEYSRLMPAVNRFPSAAGRAGFKPLAAYVHALGLKFGIHILRGIPRQAVRENTPIPGTNVTAREIADTSSVCEWNHDMYGVDMGKRGAAEYYNSLFELYASWGVDFVKVDDIARPYHKSEIEAVSRAIKRCGRPIVLSISPGPTPLSEAEHVRRHANMWRVRDDFWDDWKAVEEMFDLAHDWAPYTGGGAWADLDMLPLGRIGIRSKGGGRSSNFTFEEARAVMSLWAIMGSPLMFGGHLPETDGKTLSLIMNDEVLKLCRTSEKPREAPSRKPFRVFENSAGYKAVFNMGTESAIYNGSIGEKDLWTGKKPDREIAPHGALLTKQ